MGLFAALTVAFGLSDNIGLSFICLTMLGACDMLRRHPADPDSGAHTRLDAGSGQRGKFCIYWRID